VSETDAVETAVKTPAKRGNFFHIDRRTWAALCDIGDVKLAVSYLVIVQGTGRGGKLSKWSAKSIESHTGLHSIYPPSVLAEIFEESREPKILPINVKTKAQSYESRRLPSGCILITLHKDHCMVEEQSVVFKRNRSNLSRTISGIYPLKMARKSIGNQND
jgi:hypothetical protein